MSTGTPDEVFAYDEEGHLDGYQMPSVARKIQEWREGKEEAEFEALCQTLARRKYHQQWRDAHREEVRETHRRRWRNLTPEQRAELRAQRREWAQRRRDAAGPVSNVCEACGKLFTLTGRKARARFCTKRCNKRNWNKRQQAKNLNTAKVSP